MYEMAKKAREAMRGKAKRLAGETDSKVDSSNWTPAEPLNADVKTGMRPISKRAYKKGGKVEGAKAMTHAGRKPRKSGGRAITADSLINRDQKEANEDREGKKHVGALKTGGRAGKALGGAPTDALKQIRQQTMGFKKGGDVPKKAMGGLGMGVPVGAGRGAPAPVNPRMLAMLKEKRANAARGVPPAASMAPPAGGMPPMKKGGSVPKKAGGGERSALDRIKDAAGYNSPDYQPSKPNPDYQPKGGPSEEDKEALKAKIEGRKSGGRAARKAGGNVNYGPMEMPAGKKGASLKEQEAIAKHDQDLSKPKRGKAGHYDYGGIVPAGATGPDGRLGIVNPRAMNFGSGPSATPQLKKGGMAKWEGSAKDEAQDKKLAKKHGMSMKSWEASKMDEKHDKQESMKGLKRGGEAKKWISEAIGKPGALHKSLGVPAGEKIPAKKLEKAENSKNPKLAKRAHLAETLKHISRANKFGGGALSDLNMGPAKATGGATKGKGKTNINIVINPGAKPDDQMAGMPGMPPGLPPRPPGGVPVPMGMPPAGAPPAAAPMPMPMPMPMPPSGGGMPPMGRKAGGKVYRSYKDMDAGAGSGLGRLEKTEIQKRKA